MYINKYLILYNLRVCDIGIL